MWWNRASLRRRKYTWATIAIGTLILMLLTLPPRPKYVTKVIRQVIPTTYDDLLAVDSTELGNVDIARMNLLCVSGLPGGKHVDVSKVVVQLDRWAERVRVETERHLYRVNDPRFADHYGHSEARLRAEFIVQVLQEDCGVHYNVERARNVDFSKPEDLFIHGLAGGDHAGTCSSMPVLYAAIGRRLGYPIRLALAKQHIYCRWEDGKERFNIEGAGNGGVDFPPDDHYRNWPVPLTTAEIESGEFLRSLSPREELATFLLQRAACLRAHERALEERACLQEAVRLMPNSITLRMAIEKASQGKAVPSEGVALGP